MHSFRLVPEIRQYDTTKEFCADLHIGKGDLLLISESLYNKFFKQHDKGAITVFYRKYGSGEPTDMMVEGAGTYNNVIRFLAPLVMTDEQLAAGLDIFENAVAVCAARQ
ncbi:hypothetical protein [Fusicatenibacter sp.]